MKKTILEAACALSLLLAACSTSPEKEAINILNNTTKQLQKTTSLDEVKKVLFEFDCNAKNFKYKYPDFIIIDNWDYPDVQRAQKRFDETMETLENVYGFDRNDPMYEW